MKTPTFAPPRPTTAVLARFFGRVVVQENGCWSWTGGVNNKGYAIFNSQNAHRISYAWFVGTVPANHEVDHLCRNRRCVNPAHGEAVTGRENRWRANLFETTGRCRRGHVLSIVGLAYNASGADRVCRECRRIPQAKYFQRIGRPLGDLLQATLVRESMRLSREIRRQREAVAS